MAPDDRLAGYKLIEVGSLVNFDIVETKVDEAVRGDESLVEVNMLLGEVEDQGLEEGEEPFRSEDHEWGGLGFMFCLAVLSFHDARPRGVSERVKKLEDLFPGRKSTPDGHLVGSLGEGLASHKYGLDLLPNSTELHDAKAPDGRLVQIKATQGRSVALRGSKPPDHLLVLKLNRNGSADEVFNGPGDLAWAKAGARGSNGQRPISLSMLAMLMKDVPQDARLPVVRGE